jgi:hypothetical protein
MKPAVNHRHIIPPFYHARQEFVVLAQASILAQPSEGTLDNPAFGHDNESGHVAATDNLSTDIEPMATPIRQGRRVAATIQQQLRPARKQGGPLEVCASRTSLTRWYIHASVSSWCLASSLTPLNVTAR